LSESLLNAAATKFDQVEVYRIESESHPVSFESNKLKEIMRRDTSGVALRVIDDGRVGFTSTTNVAREGELESTKSTIRRVTTAHWVPS
jgi:PmbA protein